MGLRRVILAFEALICGGPITVVAIYLLWLLFMATGMVTSTVPEKLKAGLIVVSSLIALLEFWHLAGATVFGRRYIFGILFWLGLFSSFYATYCFSLVLPNAFVTLLFVGPVVAVTCHFAYLQLRYQKRNSRVAGAVIS